MPRYTPNTAALLFFLFPLIGLAQQDSTTKKMKPAHHMIGLGFRAGLNFANITHASDLNSSAQTGYHVGVFF